MKKIICVFVILALVISLSACGWKYTSIDKENNDNRMTLIYNDGFCRIYVDNETGVQYINNRGICVMIDESGKPLIYHPTEKGGAEG